MSQVLLFMCYAVYMVSLFVFIPASCVFGYPKNLPSFARAMEKNSAKQKRALRTFRWIRSTRRSGILTGWGGRCGRSSGRGVRARDLVLPVSYVPGYLGQPLLPVPLRRPPAAGREKDTGQSLGIHDLQQAGPAGIQPGLGTEECRQVVI